MEQIGQTTGKNMPIYAPDWYITEIVSNELLTDINSRLLKRNWITDD